MSSQGVVIKINNETYFKSNQNVIFEFESKKAVGYWNPNDTKGDRCIVIGGHKYFKSIQNKVYSISTEKEVGYMICM
jgi:hypothetical protein